MFIEVLDAACQSALTLAAIAVLFLLVSRSRRRLQRRILEGV